MFYFFLSVGYVTHCAQFFFLGSNQNKIKLLQKQTSSERRVESLYDGVHNGPILGTGAAGIIRKCRHRQTGIDFAVKCLNIGLIESDETIEALREEVFIMCQTDHPDIIRLEEVYESDSQIYLILDLLTGGDMFDRLEEQPDFCYSEVQCAHIVKQMTSAVRYLHSNKVIHRDLKLGEHVNLLLPFFISAIANGDHILTQELLCFCFLASNELSENFIFDNENTDSIRLIDFGLSKHFDQNGEKHNLAVGTPYTIAPEVIQGEYDEKVDVWALGVITYLLLCGETPFGGMDGECLLTVRRNILEGNLVFEPRDIWDGISDEAKNFVRRLLTKDPEKRPTACEAQQDEWLQKCANLEAGQSKPLSPNLVQSLIEFKDYSNLQKILLEVVSFTLLPEQIKDLKQEFEKVDRDGNGEITLDELKEVLMTYQDRTEGPPCDSLTLTENEVEIIFDSLHLNTKEKTIKWHKFITAGLSQCNYDDRNLRLAFNRLDHSGKGFITINDLNEMLRSKDGSMDEVILEMWKEGVKSVRCKSKDKIMFEDFQRFFKCHNKNGRMDTLQEDSVSNHASLGRSSHHANKRMSLTSERLLASTLSLGLEHSDSHSYGHSESTSFEDDVEVLTLSAAMMTTNNSEPRRSFSVATNNDGPARRASFQRPARRRSSGCAILIQSRDLGVLD